MYVACTSYVVLCRCPVACMYELAGSVCKCLWLAASSTAALCRTQLPPLFTLGTLLVRMVVIIIVVIIIIKFLLMSMYFYCLFAVIAFPLPSSWQHLSNDSCPEDKRKDYQTVLCCTVYDSCASDNVRTYIWTGLKVDCWFRFSLDLGLLFVCFCHFVLVLFAFVVVGIVSSELSQEIGYEERLQNDHFLLVGLKTLTQSMVAVIGVSDRQHCGKQILECWILNFVLYLLLWCSKSCVWWWCLLNVCYK